VRDETHESRASPDAPPSTNRTFKAATLDSHLNGKEPKSNKSKGKQLYGTVGDE